MRTSINSLAAVGLLLLVMNCKEEGSGPGSSSGPRNFLSGETYTSLSIELVAVTGFEPTATAVNNLKSFLQARLNKPSGITVSQSSIASPGGAALTLDQLKALETTHRTQQNSGTTSTAFYLVVDSDYAGNSGNSKVLGIAYGSSSVVIFEKTIREFSGALGQPAVADLETTVMNHEFGHLLGLVNNGTGTTTSHQDTAHGKHCNNTDCLMYYQAETSDGIAALLGMGSAPPLDSNCISDLQSNGGK